MTVRIDGRATRPRKESSNAEPVDVHVGERIRLRRAAMNIQQERLADAIGVTFQQVAKYEGGANRVSASRLWMIATELKVPVGWFFEGLAGVPEPTLSARELSVLIEIRGWPDVAITALVEMASTLRRRGGT